MLKPSIEVAVVRLPPVRESCRMLSLSRFDAGEAGRRWLAAVGVALLLACQSISPSNTTDSSLPTLAQCQTACAVLAAAPCALGSDPLCPTFLMSYSVDRDHANVATGKVFSCTDITSATVKSKLDAQKMGFVCQ